MAHIKIDKLEIKFKGLSEQVARKSLDGLGNELIKELAKQFPHQQKNQLIKMNKIDLVAFSTQNTSSSDLQKMIIGKIGDSIKAKSL